MAALNSLTSASGQCTYDHAIRELVTWTAVGTAQPADQLVELARVELAQNVSEA
jgi:hypothetical protein